MNLREPAIRAELGPSVSKHLSKIEIFQSLPSTNTYLMTLSDVRSGQICLAEQQSAGKGRRGRAWVSPLGQNIAFSVAWFLTDMEEKHQGMALMVGVSVMQGLEACGVKGAKLKWPNDLTYHQRKLGGILVEVKRLEKETLCVIGIGINMNLSAEAGSVIDQPWTDLTRVMQKTPSRNKIVGQIVNVLLQALPVFTSQGLSPFLEAWRSYDALQGQAVVIRKEDQEIMGVAVGVDETGALLVNIAGVIKKFNSGEVSVR